LLMNLSNISHMKKFANTSIRSI
jgi:hypothetical protein